MLAATTTAAWAGEHYRLTITNGSGMPLSPGALYVMDGHKSVTEVGAAPSPGLVQLCTSGNNATILDELKANREIVSVQATPGLVLPGQTISVDFFTGRSGQSVHFVAMYGKTKDTCSVIDLSRAILKETHEGPSTGVDRAVATGAFSDPAVPQGNSGVCAAANDAIGCIRLLTQPIQQASIRFFPGYLPSVLDYVEALFGASSVTPLLLQGGAVTYSLQRL